MVKRLGKLQIYILKACFQKRGKRLSKKEIFGFYKIKDSKNKNYNKAHSTIIKTIRGLIKKGYLSGYGWRSPKEWHIREIKLTPRGRKVIKKILLSRQLPLFK